MSSDSTRTPTSIDVLQAALTVALSVSRCPTKTGCRNVMRSIATVTTRQPEWRTAAMPATSSQRYMITPPCTLPELLASLTLIHRLSSEREWDGGLGCTAPGSLGCSVPERHAS